MSQQYLEFLEFAESCWEAGQQGAAIQFEAAQSLQLAEFLRNLRDLAPVCAVQGLTRKKTHRQA